MQNIYSILSPIAVVLLVMELIYSIVSKKNLYSFQETLTNISTGLGNQMVNLLVMGLVYESYRPLYEHYSLMKFSETWYNFILLLVLVDFIFYWVHRFGHSINIMWAAHSPHHSAEEMNLAVALRASVTMRLFSFFFFWPLALLGFSPESIYAASGVQLIIAFWHHTKVIKKMGWYEKWFNTPSHHRVHHGTNQKYLDKNFGEIFIIWDKWFGTFQAEEEEVNYGILRHPKTWNPITINFHFWNLLFQDFLETKNWWDKIRLWFMPLGWRPSDVTAPREPVKAFGVGEKEKFLTVPFRESNIYLILQLIAYLMLMMITINLNNPLNIPERIVLGLFIWWAMINWGGLMEKKSWAPYSELLSSFLTVVFGSYLLATYNQEHWPILLLAGFGLYSIWWNFQKFLPQVGT